MIWRLHERSFLLAPLRDKRRDRGEADRRKAKPYIIVRDISTRGSGQWPGGVYIAKAAARKSKANVIVITCSENGTIRPVIST
jgi:hypothetical protein